MTVTALFLLWAFTILLGLDLGAGFYDGDAYMRFSPSAGMIPQGEVVSMVRV
jgi:hypothetical protein